MTERWRTITAIRSFNEGRYLHSVVRDMEKAGRAWTLESQAVAS